MARHNPKTHPFRRTLLGALLAVLIAGFYLTSSQLVGWRTVDAGAPVNQPAQKLPCEAADAGYCSLMRRLVPAVEVGDFSLLLASPSSASTTCSDPAAGQYCSGVATGVPVSLYTVYQAGQPTRMRRNDYIAFWRSYAARAGKLTYMTSKAGTQNPLLFRNQQGAVSLQLQLQQMSNGSWQFLWPIVVN